MDDHVSFVIDRFNSMISADGATIVVEGIDNGVLNLRYQEGEAGACEACVLAPEDLEALIGEALAGKASGVSSVHVAS
jgi:Fe-S cluster biogenesis protein NfuA